MTESTPRPWRVHGPNEFGDTRIVREGTGDVVALMSRADTSTPGAAANASLIVAAVNAEPLTAEALLMAYEAEIESRGIPPVAGPEYRAARLSLIEGTLRRLNRPV